MDHFEKTLRALGLSLGGVALSFGLMAPAGANGLAQLPSIPSALAVDAASAAKDACVKAGFHVTVTVVDAAGVVLVTLRDDGAAPHTVSTSQRKAYTALSSRMPTSQMVKVVVANADAAGLRQVDGFLLLSGGTPIKVGENVVGAIGVSGGLGPDSDEKCAVAGITSIASRLAAAGT